MSKTSRRYQVALSFAGEDRPYVDRVAQELKRAGVSVFYDRYEEAALWGKNLYDHLRRVYSEESDFAIIFISAAYAAKVWTNHERESAQARAINEHREYILPARFDDTNLPGLLQTVGYVDLRQKTPADFAQLIMNKLGIDESQVVSSANAPDVCADDSPAIIEFVSLYEPDEVSLTKFYQHLFRRAATLVRITASTFQPPSKEMRPAFDAHIAAMPVLISWPEPVVSLQRSARAALPALASYRHKSSTFYGMEHKRAAQLLSDVSRAVALFDELEQALPRRLPRLWLSVLDYSSPFPDSSLTFPYAVRNFLRFAAVYLYYLLSFSDTRLQRAADPIISQHIQRHHSWKEAGAMLFSGSDEILRAYVDRATGVSFQEIVVYAPRQLTLAAYRSSMSREPIMNGWFSEYFVPQLEIQFARDCPDLATSYCEEAHIRRVCDANGDEVRAFGSWLPA